MILRLGFLLLLTIGCQSTPKTKATKPVSSVGFSEFMKVITPRGDILPLPGGQESLLLANLPDDPYVKLYRLNHKDHQFKQDLDAGQSISSLRRDPKLKRIYVMLDDDGDENTGIYHYDTASHELTDVFVKEGFRSSIEDFSADGETLYILSNYENKAIYSLYKLDAKSLKSSRLSDGQRSWDRAVVSPDGKTIALQAHRDNGTSEIVLLDAKSKKVSPLLARPNTVYQPAFFHPKKKELYVNSDEGRDRSGCAKISLMGKGALEWVRVQDGRDVNCGYDGASLLSYVEESDAGRTHLFLYEGIFEREITFARPEGANISGVMAMPGDEEIYFKMSRSNAPAEFYTIKRKGGADASPQRISKLNQSRLTEKDFGVSMDFRFASFDGTEIHGLIFAKPEWTASNVKRPLIIWPHGGPDYLVRHEYMSTFQYWVQQGYVIFAPNFRGSIGYGKKFEAMNDRDWGGGHIKDVVWGKREVAKLPYIDGDNVFIVGRSFGGYSTLSAITSYPDEFKGAVAMVAIANLFTFLKSIPPDPSWQEEFLKEVGDPVEDSELLMERSPYFHANKVKTPLLIYQAEKDVRTVVGEMDAYVEKLRESNIPVKYEVLKNEGHFISRRENLDKVMQGTIDFLNQIILR